MREKARHEPRRVYYEQLPYPHKGVDLWWNRTSADESIQVHELALRIYAVFFLIPDQER